MDAAAYIAQVQQLAIWTAKEANVRIRMMKAGATGVSTIGELEEELAHAQLQVQRLRSIPGYEAMPDPTTINPSHRVCEAESDSLRTKNLKLKVQLDKLWAKAAHLEAELREVKPSRYPLQKPKIGRPRGNRHHLGPARAAAEIEKAIGMPVRRMGPKGAYYLSEAAGLAILRMLREADECRLLHQHTPSLQVLVGGVKP